jgi:2-polyprenyl-3-methyl-5-hydroxy-6-metoxy-1,4-benzoquinol methylase
MKECGWDVSGVDYNEKMVELAREEMGIDARVGQLEDAAFEDDSFDVVTLWGVLEHVQSPRETIAEINRITSDGALLVIYTQNAAAPEARMLGEDWFIYEAPRHLYSFDAGNLTRLLESEGFKVADVVYETPLYYCQMNWQYFKDHRLGLNGDVVHQPSLLDRVAVKALSFYRKAVEGRDWSSAMTVFAVKQDGNGSAAPVEANIIKEEDED